MDRDRLDDDIRLCESMIRTAESNYAAAEAAREKAEAAKVAAAKEARVARESLKGLLERKLRIVNAHLEMAP